MENDRIKTFFKYKLQKSRYPVVRQYDQIDCGPAALLSVLKYYGGNTSLVTVRELCQTDVKGSSMLGLVRAAKSLGFEAHGASGNYEELMGEEMPCIAHVTLNSSLNHFIVIYKMYSREVLIGDPGKGITKLTKTDFEKIWKQNAVILLRPIRILTNDTPLSWFEWIAGYLKNQESWIYQTLFLGIIYTMLGLTTAVFIQWLIDRFIPEQNFSKIVYTGLFLMVLLICRTLAGYFRQKFLIVLNRRISIHINSDFLSHIFQIPKRFFDTRKTGDITTRIDDGMKIQQAILLITNTTIIDGLVIMGSFLLMFHLAPAVAWISLVIVPMYGGVLISKTRTIKGEQNEVMKAHAKVQSSYINSLQGIDIIIGFNVSRPFALFNKNIFTHFQKRIEKLGFIQAHLSLYAELSGTMITISLLSLGSILVIKDRLLLGQLIAAYSLLVNILPAINRFIGAYIALQGANMAAQRLRDILLVKKEEHTGKLPIQMINELTILDGGFSWPKGQHMFRSLNISLEKGKLISLWGRSGSGKSTLVQLLQQIYPMSEGQILIDKTPAEQFDLAEYRKSIGVVPQEINLINGTLAENITIGRKVKSYEEILIQINHLGFDSFLSRFDQRLYTQLGEEGRKLSGGELQMLALIRALYNYPEVIIIDEGLNAMDIETENLILGTLRRYAQNHAVLIITHNLRTISQTDKVYILERGGIVESGNPKSLAHHETSRFKNLLYLQGNDTKLSYNYN